MPEPTDASLATRIAERILLTHFPADAQPADVLGWEALRSKAARGAAVPDGNRAQRLRDEHVFLYAGPACFWKRDAVGAVVLVLRAGAEGAGGAATPFDSGALVGPGRACLEPFAGHAADERHALLDACSHPLATWRDAFGRWLSRCYDDPGRYLETSSHKNARWTDAKPDRTEPPELREHNGPGRGSDRRAWTWELRIPHEVKLRERVAHVLVAPHRLQEALASPHYEDRVVVAEPSAPERYLATLYRESGRLLREACAEARP